MSDWRKDLKDSLSGDDKSHSFEQEYTYVALDAPINNDISFFVKDSSEAALRLCEDGNIYVNGRLAENDLEVVDAMRRFLESGFGLL